MPWAKIVGTGYSYFTLYIHKCNLKYSDSFGMEARRPASGNFLEICQSEEDSTEEPELWRWGPTMIYSPNVFLLHSVE